MTKRQEDEDGVNDDDGFRSVGMEFGDGWLWL